MNIDNENNENNIPTNENICLRQTPTFIKLLTNIRFSLLANMRCFSWTTKSRCIFNNKSFGIVFSGAEEPKPNPFNQTLGLKSYL